MSHIRKKGNKMQQEFLVAERSERERLTERYVDEDYEWKGDFA
jgi:hypothetical protein